MIQREVSHLMDPNQRVVKQLQIERGRYTFKTNFKPTESLGNEMRVTDIKDDFNQQTANGTKYYNTVVQRGGSHTYMCWCGNKEAVSAIAVAEMSDLDKSNSRKRDIVINQVYLGLITDDRVVVCCRQFKEHLLKLQDKAGDITKRSVKFTNSMVIQEGNEVPLFGDGVAKDSVSEARLMEVIAMKGLPEFLMGEQIRRIGQPQKNQ